MKHHHSLLTAFSLLAAAISSEAQLTLNQVGGTIGGGNYGTQAGTSAFGLDEIGGGTIIGQRVLRLDATELAGRIHGRMV